MILLLETAIKSSVILLAALGVMPLLTNRSSSFRHWVLGAAIGCAAITPLLAMVVPSWHLPARLMRAGSSVVETTSPVGVQTSIAVVNDSARQGGARAMRAQADGPENALAVESVARSAWIAGATMCAAVLLVGFARLTRLASGGRRITDGAWARCAEEIRRAYGLRRPVLLLETSHPTLLVTWGSWQPKVIVPGAAREWREDRVRVVLSHELAHVRRGDWLVQLAAEILRCAYWFNPLFWIVCSRLRRESEQACDDAVLNSGVDGSEYASELVSIARDLRQRSLWVPAAAIARLSNLERRVTAMLDARLSRRPVSRSWSTATSIALLAVTIPVAGFAFGQTAFSTLSGSVVDPMNAALPGVTLAMSNAESKARYEVQSDRTGRYQFVGLVPGEYLFEARLPGFAMLQRKLTLAGESMQQDLTLQVGSVSESITVVETVLPSSSPEVDRPREAPRRDRTAKACGSQPTTGSTPIGGNLRVPVKLKDVRPEFPAALRGSGTEGTVLLQGRIGTDGFVNHIEIVSTPHADLANAAIDAVRQWEFDPTLLNCVPIEVPISIAVAFRQQR